MNGIPSFGPGVHVRVAQRKPYRILVVGERYETLSDLYHRFLRMPWTAAIVLICALFFATNLTFALAYFVVGGVAHMNPGAFADAFFFSVQTMGTIGYGAMYPQSTAAHLLVTAESLASLLVTAISAGLVFAKVSQPNGRLVFSSNAVITPFEGVPTLMIRLGNERTNQIVEAQVHVDLVRTMITTEGTPFYKQSELKLVKQRSAALARSWTVLHTIDETSPLFGESPESMAANETEIIVSVMGIDDTSAQPAHGRHSYTYKEILFGAKHTDILSEHENGDLVLDIRRFHETQASAKTNNFPYGA
jgi:inward rectifier potassium channel